MVRMTPPKVKRVDKIRTHLYSHRAMQSAPTREPVRNFDPICPCGHHWLDHRQMKPNHCSKYQCPDFGTAPQPPKDAAPTK